MHVQDPLSDVFCSAHIQWQHRPQNLDSLTRLNCSWENNDAAFESPCTFGKHSSSSLEVDFDKAFGDTEMVQIHAQNGLLNWLFKHPIYAGLLNKLGLNINNAYGCLSNFAFQAAPTLQQQLPGDVLQALRNSTVIGLQVRYAALDVTLIHSWSAISPRFLALPTTSPKLSLTASKKAHCTWPPLRVAYVI